MASCIMPLLAGLAAASLVPGAAGAAGPTTPKFKWAQNQQLIFLSVFVRDFDKESVSMSLSADGDVFSFRAKNNEGKEFALDLPLREDVVVPGSIKWEVSKRPDKAGNVPLVTTLAKRNEHRWDTLVTNPKTFKGIMDKDWTREDQNLEVEEEAPYLEDHAFYMQALTEKNFNKTLAKFSAVMANVRYPWCSSCGFMDTTYAKAAKHVKQEWRKDPAWKRAVFTVVDAREQRQLGRWLGANCSYECTIKIFSGPDEEPVTVKPKQNEIDFLFDIVKYLHPRVHVLKSPADLDPLKKKNTTCVGSFASNSTAEYSLFHHVADLLRGDLAFAAIFGEEKPLKVWPHDQGVSYEYDGTWADNGSSLLDWIRVRAVPLLQDYHWTMHDKYEGLKLPIGKVWVNNNETDEANTHLTMLSRQVARKLARKYAGKIAFISQNRTSYYYEMKEFGLNLPEAYPAFGIASNGSYGAAKFGFEITPEVAPSVGEFWRDPDRAYDLLTSFCDQVLAGQWPEAHESGPLQYNWTQGTAKQLVYRSYNDIRNPERPLLLSLYGRYRKMHEEKMTELENLAKVLEPNAEAFTVAGYDTTENYVPPEDFKRAKYASETEWYWVPQRPADAEKPKMKKLTKPKADAPVKTVIEFLKKHSGLDIDVDDVMERFEVQMRENPPPPTTTPRPSMMSSLGPGLTELKVQADTGSAGEGSQSEDGGAVGGDEDSGAASSEGKEQDEL